LAGEEPVGVGAESRELAALESPIVIEGEAGEGAAIGDTTADGDAGAGAEDLTMEGRTGHWDVDARSVWWWSRGPMSASNGGVSVVEEPSVTEELRLVAIGMAMNGN
jgi:hypothetical protein